MSHKRGRGRETGTEIPNYVKVRTDPKKGWEDRFHAISDARAVLDEGNNTSAVVAACRHVRADEKSKRRALEYLTGRLAPDELATVVDILSTPHLPVGCQIEVQPADGRETPEPDTTVHVGHVGDE